MRIIVSPTCSRAVKRLHKNQKADLDDAVRDIAGDPALGEAKVGDLAGVDGSVWSATFGGRFGRRQPMKQGSCFQR